MKKLIDVPYIDQTKDWPTGCESVSAVMLLKYLGLPITVERFVRDYLPQEPMKKIDGVLYGPDPNVKFAGSPKDPDSFGCYPPVIVEALNKYFAEYRGYRAEDATGVSDVNLLLENVYQDMPVIYWTSLDLDPTYPGPVWVNTATGHAFTWISNEHCMLLVGYDDEADMLIFNDPWQNHSVVAAPRALAEKRHAELGRRAVIVRIR
ncbi:MAG: C39 family peptidase [Lachnospiraceae bacterium]|jgi:uncharacterized protein YvpB|nr:C39 family peptidase [Lachnospiraceae bacterium]